MKLLLKMIPNTTQQLLSAAKHVNIRYRLMAILISGLLAGCTPSEEIKDVRLQTFPLSSVRLLESPFQNAQQVDMQYILELDADRLLAPFLIDAGIEPKAERYGNWENTGLDGHIGGHYLSALALMYASTGNAELMERLNYMIDALEECQQKNGNGYVGGVPDGQKIWKEIAEGNIDAGNFSLNGKWVPLYNIHKIFAGLRDAYLIAGNEKAKGMLVDLTDWFIGITSGLSEEQIQDMLRSEHGGLNEVFADVAAITGDNKYLELAEKFSHRLILDPLLQKEDKLTGLHANTQIPKVIGFERVAVLSENKSWEEAAKFFWETVVNDRSVSIGGNSVREHFHPTDDFGPMLESNQGPETCNTYNMLRLTQMLFLSSGNASYLDYFERATYNHILSSQHPEKGGFVYFTPMRPRHYRVYSQPHEGFWCCVGSGLENHGKYGELIYAHNDEDIYVNLFMASTLNWKEKGIVLTQNTKFPFEETSEIKLELDEPQQFALHIRYPGWVKAGELKLAINGEVQKISTAPSSFISVDRKWKTGDVVSITLPMHTQAEPLPDNSPWVSFVHGPVVLAAVTETDNLDGLWADDSRMGHVAGGRLYPVEEAPMIVTETDDVVTNVRRVEGEPLTFSVSGLYPEEYRDIKLIPFFNIHEARYMLYWPVTTPQELEEKKQAMREKEQEMLALEAITVDQVATGEQQPESDHNFKGEKTEMGIHEGRFWRHAQGWFSYDLKDKNREGKTLRITYSGADKGRTFDILINEKHLATVTLEGSESAFYDLDYQIPAEIITGSPGNILTVKFVAHEGSMAGGVYHVRLMK